MGQTKEGARKAYQTTLERHGFKWIQERGARGGRASGTGGFYANTELAVTAGAKGGSISRRKPKK